VPVALAGGAMGLINALGNLGGFAGPYVGGWLQDASGGSFLSTAVVLAVSLLLGGLVMITLRKQADRLPSGRRARGSRPRGSRPRPAPGPADRVPGPAPKDGISRTSGRLRGVRLVRLGSETCGS